MWHCIPLQMSNVRAGGANRSGRVATTNHILNETNFACFPFICHVAEMKIFVTEIQILFKKIRCVLIYKARNIVCSCLKPIEVGTYFLFFVQYNLDVYECLRQRKKMFLWMFFFHSLWSENYKRWTGQESCSSNNKESKKIPYY